MRLNETIIGRCHLSSAHHVNPPNAQKGFTLIEVIFVLALIGVIVTTVRYSVFTSKTEKEVEDQVKRLQVVFNMASDYAVINQLELGLRIDDKEQSYEFVMLDENEKWQAINGQKHLEKVTMPEEITLELNLEGLPWQEEDSLFDESIFDEELSVSSDGVDIGNEEDIEPPPPQIFILSSGEITPFELRIRYTGLNIDDETFEFTLQGQETVPLKREGPL